MKTHAQMETQVDFGIWNMLGEDQVTARLGSAISMYHFPPTNQNLPYNPIGTTQTRKCSRSTYRAC